MNLDIDCLRTFLIVCENMSFSSAAEFVGRSQSTVSQQINKLEQQVGRSLLKRRKGRVLELTLEGSNLLPYARRILQLNDEAYALMADNVLTGSVRLGVPLDFFGRDFTSWLNGFKTLHPMVGLEVEANQSENLLKRSTRGEFDLAFFKQDADAGAAGGAVVMREQLVWAAGANFSVGVQDSMPLILFPDGCAYRRHAISALRDDGRRWHVSFVSPSFECLRSAAIDGMGITVLARALVTPPLRILGRGLPQLPAIEMVCAQGKRANARVVAKLASYLTDSLINSSVTRTAKALS